MNRFILACTALSALALLVSFFSWVLKPAIPTVTLTAKEWMCVESAPNGLQAQCTMYTRAPIKAGAKQ